MPCAEALGMEPICTSANVLRVSSWSVAEIMVSNKLGQAQGHG